MENAENYDVRIFIYTFYDIVFYEVLDFLFVYRIRVCKKIRNINKSFYVIYEIGNKDNIYIIKRRLSQTCTAGRRRSERGKIL